MIKENRVTFDLLIIFLSWHLQQIYHAVNHTVNHDSDKKKFHFLCEFKKNYNKFSIDCLKGLKLNIWIFSGGFKQYF